MQTGFIGAGFMGHGMAACLLSAGHAVTVLAHRNRAPVDDLVARGAREADTAGEETRQQHSKQEIKRSRGQTIRGRWGRAQGRPTQTPQSIQNR